MNDTIFICPTEGGIKKTSPENINWQSVDSISANVTGISIRNDTIFAVASDKVLYSKYSQMNNIWNELTTIGLPVLGTNLLRSSTICNNNLIVGSFGTNDNNGLGIWYINLNEIFTSINDLENKNEISVYPNPANNLLFINRFIKNSKMSIFDISGKIIINKKVTKNQIDISNFQNGIYIINIETENGIVTKKFVKQ